VLFCGSLPTWFDLPESGASEKIDSTEGELRQLLAYHNIDWDSSEGRHLRRASAGHLPWSLFCVIRNGLSEDGISNLIKKHPRAIPELFPEHAELLETIIHLLVAMSDKAANSFIQCATNVFLNPGSCQRMNEIQFSKYIPRGGSIDLGQVGRDMVGVLHTEKFSKNIEAQKLFRKLFRIFINQGNVVGNLSRITADEFKDNAGNMQRLLRIPEGEITNQYLRQLAMDAVFQTQIRQEAGVGSCFAVAPAVMMQENDPAVLMNIVTNMLIYDKISYIKPDGSIDQINVNRYASVKQSQCRILQNVMVYTLADANVQIDHVSGRPGNAIEMAREIFISPFAMLLNSIMRCDIPAKARETLQLMVDPLLSDTDFQFDARCDTSAWGKKYANPLRQAMEGNGVFICHTNEGDIITIGQCKKLMKNIISLLKQCESHKSVTDSIAALEKFTFGDNEPPSGGQELYTMQCLLGSRITAAASLDLDMMSHDEFGDSALILEKWYEVARNERLAPMDRILASGGGDNCLGHVYTIDFSFMPPNFVAQWGNPRWLANVLTWLHENPKRIFFFIDTNWSSGDTSCKIGIHSTGTSIV
jgi:hypothetical protein